MSCNVLLVDDDADVRASVGQSLELAGFSVIRAAAFIVAIDSLSPGFEGVVVSDIRMPGKDGFDLLKRCRRIDPDIPVIMLTGEGDIPMAVRAMSEGAYDFLEKPCAPRALIASVERAWEKRRLVLENRRLNAQQHAVLSVARAGGKLTAQMEMVERLLLEEALRAHLGKASAAAESLGVPRKTLYDKMKRHGIDPSAFRP
jgi:two-component system C4-dicarboxylate transport response regulator DctD